jgi:hypothetical protein
VIPPDALQLAASVGFLILGTRLILRSGGGAGEATEAAQTGEKSTDP